MFMEDRDGGRHSYSPKVNASKVVEREFEGSRVQFIVQSRPRNVRVRVYFGPESCTKETAKLNYNCH